MKNIHPTLQFYTKKCNNRHLKRLFLRFPSYLETICVIKDFLSSLMIRICIGFNGLAKKNEEIGHKNVKNFLHEIDGSMHSLRFQAPNIPDSHLVLVCFFL